MLHAIINEDCSERKVSDVSDDVKSVENLLAIVTATFGK